MSRRYFEEEMRYLHEAGKLFAEAHPEQARFLNIDSVTDRDPYVERLFEGFAFLTGRIREQLDDELPQYTESLCRLLFPHFLKPVPALTLVQFTPRPGEVQETRVVERGTEVRSEPVGERQTVCRFVTTQAVRLQPLALEEAALQWQPGGTSTALLRFRLDDRADPGRLRLSPLRLHFHADPTVASLMHLFFTRHVSRVEIAGLTPTGTETHPITLHGPAWVRPGGLDDDESLLPDTPHVFGGFRLLQEYFAFRRKFWCVDLYGLDRYRPGSSGTTFLVKVHFDRSYPEDKRFRTEDVRLFCTPAVNLFEADAEPILVDHRVSEYRVVADVRRQQEVEVYDVVGGVAVDERTRRRRRYVPFYGFEHMSSPETRYFVPSTRFGLTGRFETYVSLDTLEQEQIDLAPETLSLEIRCTNGSLPREKLRERMIRQLAPEVPKLAEPSNLTQPTLILYPPLRERRHFFWQLISHWSLNFRTLASAEALKGLLELYDWTGTDANRRRIAGLREVRWRPKEVLRRNSVLRGAEVVVRVQEGHFADEGDVCLFGLVLSRFFSTFATINSFVHLTIEMVPSGTTYQWQPEKGTRPTL
ncbi:MAG: type VI secretion protein ImpG [Rhodothermaceae bacterium]|nr:MAG: type VI secretion protein ImpG [Rhodothermaceae bacterium]